MECPKCRHDNPDGQKFCGECANPLAVVTAESTPIRPLVGERRQATIVFSDLSGYTAMNERLDPEEVQALMSRIKLEAVRIVESHGGIVNQFVGDEVVALFGIPTAHEDDPIQAVGAARDLHDMVRAISPEVEKQIEAPLRLHSGIATGLIVTDNTDRRDGTYGITGDTVNTGARLASHAKSDAILCSEESQRRIADYFQCEALEPVKLKGKAGKVTPWRVIEQTGVKTRFEAAQRRGLTRYVGRDRELKSLREAFQQAKEGRGQAICLIGEAGLGKSRLLHEFQHELELERVNLVIGHGTATGENLSYFPIQDLLKRWFAITEVDSSATMLNKIEVSLGGLDTALPEHLPAILHLLSVQSDQGFPPEMVGEAIERKITAALKAVVTAASHKRPLVMIFEDLHWFDEKTEAILQEYIEILASRRILLLMSFRPEYRPIWGDYGYLAALVLGPLADRATAEIIASTLGVADLPEGIARAIHARTEGNPFFTEEIALSLREDGSLRMDNGQVVLARPLNEIGFPDSVQAVVRERMDRLLEAQRDTLRLASVVGREFTENLVTRLSKIGSAIGDHLAELKNLEMILEKRIQPELEFMFKHAITHSVAYDSLLLRRRKELHKLVGLAIEELYTERLAEYYEMLAQHFDQGEVWDKAVEYMVKAGTKARQHFAIPAAAQYFDRAKDILESLSPMVPWQVRYDLFFQRSQMNGELGKWAIALDEANSAMEVARHDGSIEQRIQALFLAILASFWGHQQDETKRFIGKLAPLIANDPDSNLGLMSMEAISAFVADDLPGTLVKEQELRSLYRNHPNSAYYGLASFFLGYFSRWRGDASITVDVMAPMLPVLKETAPVNMYVEAVFDYGLALGEQGYYQQAIHVLENAREFGLQAGELYATPKVTNSLGWAFHELCLVKKAIQYNEWSLDSLQELLGLGTSTLFEIESQARINLGENYLTLGKLRKAQEYFELVYENVTNPEYYFVRPRWKARCLLGLGELWLARGDLDRSESFIGKLGEDGWTDGFPFKKYQVRAGRLRGNLLAAREKLAEAETEMKEALKKAKALGNPTELWKTHLALGDALATAGKGKQAKAQYRNAVKVVEKIAEGLTDIELKEGFLRSDTIQSLFAQAEPAARPGGG